MPKQIAPEGRSVIIVGSLLQTPVVMVNIYCVHPTLHLSNEVTFIYIVLYTIQFQSIFQGSKAVSKHSNKQENNTVVKFIN